MNSSFSIHLKSASRLLLYFFIFLFPLVAFPFTPEPLELNKQTLLLLFSFASAIALLAGWLVERRIHFRHGWLIASPVILLTAFIAPSITSVSPFLSWIGAYRQEYTSVLTVVGCAVLIFVLSQSFTTRRSHQILHSVFLFSSCLVALAAVLSFFGVPIFDKLGLAVAFNTVGTFTDFAVFLVVMNSFFICSYISHRHRDSILNDQTLGTIEHLLIFAFALVTFFFLLVLDYWPLWMLFVVSLSVPFVFVFFRADDFPNQKRLFVPLFLILIAVPFWIFARGAFFQQTPLEIAPNFESSLGVAQKTLQGFSSHFGSGPGTYFIDHMLYRDSAINQTDFWDTRFDRANSYTLTTLSTLGVFGATLFAFFIALILFGSLTQILRSSERSQWLESFVHFTPWFVLVFSAFFFSWCMTLVGCFAIFSGLLISQAVPRESSRSFGASPFLGLLCAIVFCTTVFVFLVGIFATTQRFMAEIAFARGIESARTDAQGKDSIAWFDRAARLNKYNDTYYRTLGDWLLVRLGGELSGVSEADTLTQESSKYVQSLIGAIVNAHARAIELSPYNVLNWLSRGVAYRELMSVLGDATEFAIQSHERAVELDPMNPSVATELGKTYFAASQIVRPLTASADKTVADDANEKMKQYLGKAEQIFGKAISLKSNYAPAHFELALVYDAQERTQDAIGKMESVAAYNTTDVGVMFQLGVMYLRRDAEGDVGRAQNALERAVDLSPKYSNARWYLASIYERQGDIAAAVREVEQVLKLNPDNGIVEARLERLSRGKIVTELPGEIE